MEEDQSGQSWVDGRKRGRKKWGRFGRGKCGGSGGGGGGCGGIFFLCLWTDPCSFSSVLFAILLLSCDLLRRLMQRWWRGIQGRLAFGQRTDEVGKTFSIVRKLGPEE